MLANPAKMRLIDANFHAANSYRHGTDMGTRNHGVPLAQSQHHIINSTNPSRALNDGIKNWLRIGRRAPDDAEHLSRRGLMFQASRSSALRSPSSFDSRMFSPAVVLSRCKDWSSSWRSSAIVFARLASDDFTAPRRDFASLFLDPFLFVVVITSKKHCNGDVGRGRIRCVTGRVRRDNGFPGG
jgi:hypothetical protein